ncbi:MAG: trigger factor [Lachnospiraceae bacterium]|nr:trigger factor [Lachnospiraceae bacterium]MCM1240502.1 trigger factor [Lachnospiraceae bacterium]
MKRSKAGILAMILAAGLMVGCGQSREENALRDLKTDSYVTLCDYQNMSISVEPVTVTDAERDLSVMEAYSGFATLENSGITDRAAADGDTVNIDYVGKRDDVAFDGGTASGAFLVLGSDSYIDGFEDGLVGVRPGETVDLNLTFPENYGNTELAGQAVIFTVTVNYIVELRDEVAAAMGLENVSTVAQLQQYYYDRIYASKAQDHERSVKGAIMKALFDGSTYGELPDAILESNKAYVSSIVNSAAAYGLDADTYTYTFFGMDAETYINDYATELTKQDITLQAIANQEDLNVSDKELKETLQQYAENAGAETVEEYLGNNSAEEYRNALMMEKVMDYLMEHTQIN